MIKRLKVKCKKCGATFTVYRNKDGSVMNGYCCPECTAPYVHE